MVIVILPLMSIVEDKVKYSRSLEIQAAYLGESKQKIEKYWMDRERFLCCTEAQNH